MDKRPPTEGEMLVMMIGILLAGTLIINSIVYVVMQ